MYIKFQNNLKLAVGGEWVMPSGKAEAAAFLKTHRKSRVVDQKIMGERVIGAYPGKDPGTHSGAYLVATLVPNAVVVHEMGDGQWWVTAIRDGIPLADHDKVCDWESASRIMTDVLAFNPSATLIGSAPSASRSLESVLADADKKTLAAARIASPGAALRAAGVAVGGIALAGLVVWGGWVFIVKRAAEQAPKGSALSALAVEQQKKQAAEAYRVQAVAAIKEQAAEFVRGVPAAAAIAYARGAVQGEGLSYRGWRLRSVQCDVLAGTCKKTWIKSAHGAWHIDISDIKARAGIAERAGVESVNATDIAYDFARPAPATQAIPVARADGALMAAAIRDLYSRYAIQITMPTAAVAAAATVPPAPEGATPVPAALGSTLDIKANGPLALLEAAAGHLDAIGVKVESFSVDAIDTLTPSASMSGKLIVEVVDHGAL